MTTQLHFSCPNLGVQASLDTDGSALTPRTARYSRLSNSEHPSSLFMQWDAMQAHIDRCSEISVGPMYVDVGEFGQMGETDQLPAYQSMLRDARTGAFDLLLVYKVDRVSLSAVHMLGIVEQLQRYGVGFQVLHEELEFRRPLGPLMLAFFRDFVSSLSPRMS